MKSENENILFHLITVILQADFVFLEKFIVQKSDMVKISDIKKPR